MSKPELLIIPGAWHTPASFAPTTALLEKAGYKVHGINLACYNASPPLQSFDPDVSRIKSAIESLLSAGKNLVLIYHSYGSVPGCEALAGYVKDLKAGTMKEGWGRVVRLVFVSAFALPVGGNLMAALGGKDLPWFKVSGDEVTPDNPEEIFYNDLTKDQIATLLPQIKPHSYRTFFSTLTVAPYLDIPSIYILCTLDNAIPIQAQEGMVAGAGEGVFTTERVEASHTPFVSQAEWLAGALERAAGCS